MFSMSAIDYHIIESIALFTKSRIKSSLTATDDKRLIALLH